MDTLRFAFWELMKGLSLAFLGLLAVKSVSKLTRRVGPPQGPGLVWMKSALYVLIAGMAALGARFLGYDAVAELSAWASRNDMARGQYARAFDSALHAVELRPGLVRYWRALAVAKIALRQFESVLDDEPAFRSLSGDELDETDAYNFALCHFYLGQYDRVVAVTRDLVKKNRFYAAPYVLQGMTYSAQRKYSDAALTFLDVLQRYPSNQTAVEGLAQAYYLAGKRDSALQLLDQTAKYSFPPGARHRFEALKALYAQ